MSKGKFYITTAIAYTSRKPHIGNSYEIVMTDAIARYKRLQGYDVFFQTGTDEHGQKIEEIAAAEGSEVLPFCAELEAEIASLEKEEREMFLTDLGIEKGGLDLLVQRSYHLLGLISYLTAGKPEVRAWTITRGTKAPQAAGKIHSDFERGFIRAEVISFDDLIACGSLTAAKEKGLVRSEGKEYVMNDGDVVLFRFNV